MRTVEPSPPGPQHGEDHQKHWQHCELEWLYFDTDQSLYDFMDDRNQQGLPVTELRPIIHQPTTALSHLISMGIAHDDLRPDNVMVVGYQQQPLWKSNLMTAQPGVCVQTTCYSAPEAMQRSPFNEAIDRVSGPAIQLKMQPLPDQFMEFHPIHGTNVRLDHSETQATRVESFANGVCFSKHPLKPGEIFLIEIEDKELGWCGHLRVGLTARDPGSLEVVPEYSIPDMTDSGDSWVFAITRNHNKIIEDAGAGGREEAGDGGLAGGRRLGRGEVEDGAGGGGGDNIKPKAFFTDSDLHIEDIRIPRDKLVGRSRPGRYSHILDDLYKTNTLPPTARRSRIGVLYVSKGRDLADMHIVINGEDMGASAKGIPSVQPLHAVVDVFAATKCVRIVQVEYGFSSLQTLCRKAIQKHIVHRMAIDWLELPEALKHYCKYE